jgi:GntR family transcriptional repressor for pyruvate dehydrogenase complex
VSAVGLSDQKAVNTPSAPIERKKAYELVAERLLGDIRAGRLAAGDPVPAERELTQTYGVGRSSVREALRMLESQGLIELRGSGVFSVASRPNPLNSSLNLLLTLEESNLRELFEVRKILEVEFAGLAADRRHDEDLGRMLTAVHEMKEALSSEERYIDADLRFHLAIANATKNRFAMHLMHAIRGPLHEALASIYHVPGSPQTSLEQHRLILDAVAAGDTEEARARMLEHLRRVERDVESALPPELASVDGKAPSR